MSTGKPAWSERELPAFFTRWRTDWKGEEFAPDNFLDFEGGLRFALAAAWLFCPRDDNRLGEELPQLALALGECWQEVLAVSAFG